jgi:hypothetical protein
MGHTVFSFVTHFSFPYTVAHTLNPAEESMLGTATICNKQNDDHVTTPQVCDPLPG